MVLDFRIFSFLIICIEEYPFQLIFFKYLIAINWRLAIPGVDTKVMKWFACVSNFEFRYFDRDPIPGGGGVAKFGTPSDKIGINHFLGGIKNNVIQSRRPLMAYSLVLVMKDFPLPCFFFGVPCFTLLSNHCSDEGSFSLLIFWTLLQILLVQSSAIRLTIFIHFPRGGDRRGAVPNALITVRERDTRVESK